MTDERLLKELEATLRQFPLRYAEEHALPDFRISLEICNKELQLLGLPLRAPTLASLLCDRARALRYDSERLTCIIHTLQLKTIVLREKCDWFAYALEDRSTPDEQIHDAIALAPKRVQAALHRAQITKKLKINVHSVKIEPWIYMWVETKQINGRVLSPLYLAMQPNTSFIFASRFTMPSRIANSIAIGLGWSSSRNADLSGRHLDSLLRVLQQDRNVSVNGLLVPPPYASRSVISNHGVLCMDRDYDIEYAKNIIGQDPPILRKLVGLSQQPFIDEPGSEPVELSIKLESEDVADMLASLVQVKAIAPNSPWLHTFRSTTTNIINLDNRSEFDE